MFFEFHTYYQNTSKTENLYKQLDSTFKMYQNRSFILLWYGTICVKNDRFFSYLVEVYHTNLWVKQRRVTMNSMIHRRFISIRSLCVNEARTSSWRELHLKPVKVMSIIKECPLNTRTQLILTAIPTHPLNSAETIMKHSINRNLARTCSALDTIFIKVILLIRGGLKSCGHKALMD